MLLSPNNSCAVCVTMVLQGLTLYLMGFLALLESINSPYTMQTPYSAPVSPENTHKLMGFLALLDSINSPYTMHQYSLQTNS